MTLANKLTVLRVVLIPFFIGAFYLPWPMISSVLCAALFFAAYVTDYLDGKIARTYNQITTFGKFMDPIADKLLTVSALIMLNWIGTVSPIITIIVVGREFLVSGLRLVVASEGTVIAASWLGKAKTMSQFIAIQLALLLPFLVPILGEWCNVLVQILLWVSVALTIWSGYDYVKHHGRHIQLK